MAYRYAALERHMQEDPLDLEALKSDDADAWNKAWPILYPIAYNAAWKVLRDEEQAKDVTSESVISLREHILPILNNTHLRAYLGRTARNKAITLLQRNSAQKRDCNLTESIEDYKDGTWELKISPADVPAPGSLSDKQELIQDLVSLLNHLGNPCRFLLIEHFWENARPLDLALDMSLQVTTVRMQIFRCLRRLRNMVKTNPPLMKRLNAHLGR